MDLFWLRSPVQQWPDSKLPQVVKSEKNSKICRRTEERAFLMPKMPPLPWEHVVGSLLFEYTGLSYLGLLYIKPFVQSKEQAIRHFLQEDLGMFIYLSRCYSRAA